MALVSILAELLAIEYRPFHNEARCQKCHEFLTLFSFASFNRIGCVTHAGLDTST